VKNNYLLLLITELIDNMGSKKVFTKMDLRWRFNNVRIKEGDKWKGAFIIYIGSFEPTVMFFGITNSPATFQAMINEILRDLINEGKVVAFIDNVLVGMVIFDGKDLVRECIITKKEEGHVISGNLGGLRAEKRRWNPKSSNNFPFIFYFLSFRAL